jgi:hypothetical protein
LFIAVCSALQVYTDKQGNKHLVGYVIPEVSIADVAAHCKSKLSAAMVPTVIMAMPCFPLNPNGKVERKLLPEPDFTAVQTEYVAPATDMEAVLQQVWQQTLGMETPPSVTADFFTVGGTSLIGLKVRECLLALYWTYTKMHCVISSIHHNPDGHCVGWGCRLPTMCLLA